MKRSSLFGPLAIVLLGLSSCSVDRTVYVNGNSVEWTRKNSSSYERKDSQAQLPTVTSAAFESFGTQSDAVNPPDATENLTAELVIAVSAANKNFVHPTNKVVGNDEVILASELDQLKAESERWTPVFAKVPESAGGKSQLVALLLCFFLGGIGIHRFYLGYTWQGVVQLLTLGGCGIWALIDFIRIIIGDLQPKDGTYDKTL
jgi:TM2 domain-containing membrane protein YozV